MRLKHVLPALLASSLLLPALGAAAEELPSECKRFSSRQAKPSDFQPRLARLCVRLIDANLTPGGLDAEEHEAATRLGTYLAIVGELDLRKGVVGVGRNLKLAVKPTNETSRYLIADHIGLLDMADRLAPQTETSAALR